MTIEKENELEKRIRELLEVINNSSENATVEIDEKPLTQIIRNQESEINGLKQKVAQLEQGIKDIASAPSTVPSKPVDTPSSGEAAWNKFFSDKLDITNQEDWKNSGLSTKDAEDVYKNGWKDQIRSINKDGKLDYGNDKGLDARVINKNHLDTANGLLQEINDPSKNTFQKLPENFRAQEIQDLSKFNDQLPDRKKSSDLTQAIKDRRSTFFYSLHRQEDGGITPEKYATALTNLQMSVYTAKKYRPLDSKTLNRLFKLEGNSSNYKEVNLDEPSPLYNDKSFWKNKGGYYMDEKFPGHKAQEEEWGDKNSPNFSPWRIGEHLLRDSYEINDNWDPDNPVFVEWEEKEVDIYIKTDEVIEDLSASERKKLGITSKDIKREKRKIIKPKQGHLAIGTGIGKTSKLINCLCGGGKRNVILVSPNQPLAIETHDMHDDWLQNWGCVYHKIPDGKGQYESHGQYPTVLNDLVHEVINEEGDVEMKNGVSVLNPYFLLGYLARALCDIKKIDPSVKGRDKNNPYINEKGEKEWIKQKLISEDSIIVFDEAANFADLDYREIILYTIFLNKKLKYDVLLMSATFPGVPFSLDSSYKINSYEVNLFKSKLDSMLAQQKTFAFAKNIKDIDKKILDEKDEEDNSCLLWLWCAFWKC